MSRPQLPALSFPAAILAACACACTQARAQTDVATALPSSPLISGLTLGPVDFHPRASAGVVADDNILFTSANKKSDLAWTFQPGMQAVVGDDAALIAYRDRNNDVLGLNPGGLIVQPPETWPGKIFMLDYAPRFKYYDRYTAYDAVDEFGTLNFLWPMNRLILGLRQDYQSQKALIIEAGNLATTETISTELSAAYQIGDKTSLESDFRRISTGYDLPNLIGYTEYNTEDWFNYALTESMPVSLGVLAGYDDVAANQQNETYEQLRARVRYTLTEKLTFDASGGGEMREFQNGKADTLTPVFNVAGYYRPTERTSLSLNGYRQQYASILNGYNYTTTGAMLGVRQEMTDRFTADLNAGYYSLSYEAVTSPNPGYSDGYCTAQLGLDVKIIRHLTGHLFYNLLNCQSHNAGDLNRNQIGLNVTLSY